MLLRRYYDLVMTYEGCSGDDDGEWNTTHMIM